MNEAELDMRYGVLACLAATCLAGCVTNAPIEGTVQGTNERFRGFATGTLSGTLEIVSDRTSCTGSYQTAPSGQMRGTFTCADGRSGPFEFTRTGNRAVGRFLSQPFILTFQ